MPLVRPFHEVFLFVAIPLLTLPTNFS